MSAATTVLVNSTEEEANEIDALGDMQTQVTAAKKLLKEYEERLKKLRERHADADPEQARTVPGTRYTLDLSSGNKERVVSNMNRLIEILGEDVFLQVCKVGLTDVDKYVPEHQKCEVIDSRRGSTRSAKFNRRS